MQNPSKPKFGPFIEGLRRQMAEHARKQALLDAVKAGKVVPLRRKPPQ